MVVERFSQNLINTGIFRIYIAIGFFATIIFFTFNAELFSPLQMLFGAIFQCLSHLDCNLYLERFLYIAWERNI